MSDHLGSLRAVVSGSKIDFDNDTQTDDPEILSLTDYHEFGMTMEGRSFISSTSGVVDRHGYQGSERDAEYLGGSAYTTEFRMLDARLGRWFSPDPLTQSWQTSYSSMDNNPIALTDVLGLAAAGGPGGGSSTVTPAGTNNDPSGSGVYNPDGGNGGGTSAIGSNGECFSCLGSGATPAMEPSAAAPTPTSGSAPIFTIGADYFATMNVAGEAEKATVNVQQTTGNDVKFSKPNGKAGSNSPNKVTKIDTYSWEPVPEMFSIIPPPSTIPNIAVRSIENKTVQQILTAPPGSGWDISDKSLEAMDQASTSLGMTVTLKEALIEVAEKAGDIGKGGKTYLKVMNMAGKFFGWSSAAIAWAEYKKKPTTGGRIKVYVSVATAILKVNPILAILLGLLDICGASDSLYGRIGREIDSFQVKPK